MATITAVRRVLRRKIDNYEDEVELWKSDHEQVKLYFRFCDLVRDGIELWQEINRFDENWRLAQFGGADYDIEAAHTIGELYYRFSQIAFDMEKGLLPYFEKEYDGVDLADEFRSCCRELRGILTPDSEFFDSDKLVNLRDAALDEHAGGMPLERST